MSCNFMPCNSVRQFHVLQFCVIFSAPPPLSHLVKPESTNYIYIGYATVTVTRLVIVVVVALQCVSKKRANFGK